MRSNVTRNRLGRFTNAGALAVLMMSIVLSSYSLEDIQMVYYDFSIKVFDDGDLPISEEKVTVRKLGEKEELIPVYDPAQQRHIFSSMEEGWLEIKVSRKGYESQARKVWVGKSHQTVNIYLGRPGSDYTYRDGGMYPFKADAYRLGIVFEPAELDSLKQRITSLGLRLSGYGSDGRGTVWSTKPLPAENNAELAALRQMKGIYHAGPIMSKLGANAIFDSHIVVTFSTNSSLEEKEAILKEHNLELKDKLVERTYLAGIPIGLGLGVNRLLRELNTSMAIERADPHFVPLD